MIIKLLFSDDSESCGIGCFSVGPGKQLQVCLNVDSLLNVDLGLLHMLLWSC